ncbi:MAG: DEAD/DEAH box helicase [Thermoguttaceae bacterium]
MAKLESVLSRIGVAELSKLLDTETLELLEALDLRNLTSHKLAELLVRQIGHEDLLLDERVRNELIDALPCPEAISLADLLDLDVGDGRDVWAAIRGQRFQRGNRQLRQLSQFFGCMVRDDSSDSLPPASARISVRHGLFPHQRTACGEVTRVLETGNPPRLVLHMPTGSGKTRTAMHVISQHLSRASEDTVVVWLAHTEELCEQAAEEFESAWSILGNRDCTLHRHFGPHRADLGSIRGGFLVAGLQLLYRESLAKQSVFLDLCRRVTLVAMDEAHQAIAPTYKHLLDMLAPTQRHAVLGLTATPGRSWLDEDEDRRLAEFFAHQKVTLNVAGYSSPIEYLQAEGYLSRITYDRLPFDPNGKITLTSKELEDLRAGFDIPSRVLGSLAANHRRNLLLLREIVNEAKKGSKIIVFACSVSHAELLANILRAKDVTAASVTSETRSDRRRYLVSRFRESADLQVLTNFGVLTTGFDAPKTNVAVIARPTQSVVLYSQMVGRASRGPRAGGTKTCRILTVVDNIPGFRDLSEAFKFWENIWDEHSS